jgi:hypothetical protein
MCKISTLVEKAISRHFERVLAQLKEYRLLLQTDPHLPSVCALVAGAPVRGSWWAHPLSHEIFRVNCALADHPDVLVTKLISGKLTYIDRALWPAVVTIGRAREHWQLDSLSAGALTLLGKVDRNRVEADRKWGKAASELERCLLVYSEQFHSESGAHLKRLESWDAWLDRKGLQPSKMSAAQARHTLDQLLESLNRRFNSHGRLPW